MHISYPVTNTVWQECLAGGNFCEFGERTQFCQTKTIQTCTMRTIILLHRLYTNSLFALSINFTKHYSCQTFLLYTIATC